MPSCANSPHVDCTRASPQGELQQQLRLRGWSETGTRQELVTRLMKARPQVVDPEDATRCLQAGCMAWRSGLCSCVL